MLDDAFWSKKYNTHDTGWDLGEASPPIAAFLQQYSNKNANILIPGCGNAYEAELLLQLGYKHITLIDISRVLTNNLALKFKDTSVNIIYCDFFDHQGQYDLIIEQTFFCALDPVLRPNYVAKMHTLLKEGGMLVGLLFNRDFEGGPPFGGNKENYMKLFIPFFRNINFKPSLESIKPRLNFELWFEAKKL